MTGFNNPGGWLAVLGIAFLGGALASWTGIPAAWFTGAMIATSIAAVSGLKARLPQRLFDAAMVLMGMMLGGGVTPEMVAGVGKWPLSLVCLAVAMVAVQSGVQLFLQRVGGWDRTTSFYSALPGAMIYATIAATESGADVRKVVISQLARIFLLIAVLPTVVTLIEPGREIPARVVAPIEGLALTVALGIAGSLLFHRLRMPVGLMTGSLLASAFLHGSGIVVGTFPTWVMVIGFLVIGGSVGTRFIGTTLAYMAENAVPALGAFVISAGLSGLFAFALTMAVDLPIDQVIIAFAPGGVDAMMAVALAMQMDSAYVAAHQLLRLMGVPFLAPLAARFVLRRERAAQAAE